MKYIGRNTGIIVLLFFFTVSLFWPVETIASPRKLQWGISAGVRTPGHDREVDFTCGPEVQPRARLRLSERFSLDFTGYLNTARSIEYSHISQTAYGMTVMPMYFLTPVEYAETNGRSYVGFGPVVWFAKRHGYILTEELHPVFINMPEAKDQHNIDDNWDTSYGVSVGIGGEAPIGGGKILTFDIRYMHFFIVQFYTPSMYFFHEEQDSFEYGEEGQGVRYQEEFYPTWGEYRGDLVPRKVMTISIGLLF